MDKENQERFLKICAHRSTKIIKIVQLNAEQYAPRTSWLCTIDARWQARNGRAV